MNYQEAVKFLVKVQESGRIQIPKEILKKHPYLSKTHVRVTIEVLEF